MSTNFNDRRRVGTGRRFIFNDNNVQFKTWVFFFFFLDLIRFVRRSVVSLKKYSGCTRRPRTLLIFRFDAIPTAQKKADARKPQTLSIRIVIVRIFL